MAKEPNTLLQVVLLLLLLAIVSGISGVAVMYTDFLWFNSLSLGSVYMTILSAEASIFFVVMILSFLIIALNVFIAGGGRREYMLAAFLSAVLGLISGFSWETVLKYLNQAQFGLTDPVFSMDISFYVFTLPFYRLIQNILFYILVLSMIMSAVSYIRNKGITFSKMVPGSEANRFLPGYELQVNGFELSNKVKTHFYSLIAFLFLLLTWKHFLDRYNVLYSDSGIIYGASYADVNAYLPVLLVLVYVSLLAAIMFFAASILSLKGKSSIWGLSMAVVVAYALTLFLGTGAYPALIQQYQVSPNEIVLETEYIENNIEFTRRAYGLNDIRDHAIIPRENMSAEDISKNRDIIENIRLWDWRPLKETYKQLQEIRSYYDFNDVDVDRYVLKDGYTQVLLSAREIDYRQLSSEARTWVNEHLLYTHGYGLCMSPVNRFTEGGLPEFFIKDIPPRSMLDELEIARPEIYFGEETNYFVLVKTSAEEFDYPSGDENKFIMYNGSGGVLLDSLIKKLAFSARFGDINLILSQYILPESRIMLNRNITQRAKALAPFLLYDPDPYVVTVDGRIYWVLDAYTYSNRYPYSTPYMGVNYIRNSVKVVVDAYSGDIDFYVVDSSDPFIRVYRNIFPDLFHRFEEMPAGLRKHIRYPEALFTIQANVYGTYHMTDPTVFYNKEDKWVVPNEIYGQGVKREMVPYYIISRLPGEGDQEFILMIPLTPRGKDNMIAWMVAKCDKEYGKLVIYKFPKEKLIYGPMQIEARIDQDDVISQQLTLWSQRGSNVIRGNLLIIPIDGSLLYVEPLYIQAEKATMPELKRIIVSYGSKVVMEKSLEAAFARLFEVKEGAALDEVVAGNMSISDLVEIALEHFNRGESSMKEGDWAGFGSELADIKKTLLDMKNITGTETNG